MNQTEPLLMFKVEREHRRGGRWRFAVLPPHGCRQDVVEAAHQELERALGMQAPRFPPPLSPGVTRPPHPASHHRRNPPVSRVSVSASRSDKPDPRDVSGECVCWGM